MTPARCLPQVDCCLVLFYVVHDLREGGGSLRPPGAAAPPKKSDTAFSVRRPGTPTERCDRPLDVSRGYAGIGVKEGGAGRQEGALALWEHNMEQLRNFAISRLDGFVDAA